MKELILWVMLLLLLTACSPDARVIERAEPAPEEGVRWTPEDDIPADSGDSAEDPALVRAGLACGATLVQDPMGGGGVLDVGFCARISPETPAENGDTDADAEEAQGDGEADGEAPPCGFLNLVGSARLVGPADAPALTYCDADVDGAVRFVRPLDGELEIIELVEQGCWADLDTAALRPLPDGGWQTLWVDLDSRVGGGDGGELAGVTLSDIARFEHLPESYVLPSTPWNLELFESQLLVRDLDGALYSVPWSEDGPAGEALPWAEDVGAFTALEHGSDLYVAACDAASWDLSVLHAQGGQIGELLRVTEACSYDSRPSLVRLPDGELAVGWDNGLEGFVRVIDQDGVRLAELDLGQGARFPQLAHDGARLVVLDGSGAVRWLDDEGRVLDQAMHPMVAQAPGYPVGLRLLAAPETLTVLLIGADTQPSLSGHINTFNYVELSQVATP